METELSAALQIRKAILSKIGEIEHNEITTRRNKLSDFNDLEEIKKAGFLGFRTIEELQKGVSPLFPVKGVYMVLNVCQTQPAFLQEGTGGYFKGKNPNVSLETLEANWVENSLVLYIGKTGGENSDRTLTMRIEELIAFGTGNNVAHYGGRLIWQLKNSKDLVVCWKPMLKADPETVKKELLKEFVAKYGKRPFANLKD